MSTPLSEPTKAGFLSLEFIVGEDTYWLTTGLGREGWSFTVLSRALFGDAVLHAQLIDREKDYSEITVVEKQPEGHRGNLFCHARGVPAVWLEADMFAAPRLSWNETAARLIDAIPLADQCGLWHNHAVRKVDPALQLKDVAYLVTAFLPPAEGSAHPPVFAVRGEDWGPGNPNWITFECPDEASFKQRLRQFTIEGLHLNGKWYPA